MARLAGLLHNLSTPTERISAASALMDHVYGPYDPTHSPSSSPHAWQPRPLADNKSRYLWTDAFGVVNYISLAAETGEKRYLSQADSLINAVHGTLGRERGGHHMPRLGGATNDHPCLGGLRIGKTHPEGHPDGDGQYFHYITKWAFALNRMSLASGDPKYNAWATELLEAVHPHFVYKQRTGSRLHMFWKISIDMQRPEVPSEGNLDPFDGLVTVQLVRKASSTPETTLAKEETDFQGMVDYKWKHYTSNDLLDLGEALWLAHWAPGTAWAAEISSRSATALEDLWRMGYFTEPPGYRLAFRELGTTLGVQVNEASGPVWASERVNELHRFWAPRVLERDADITPVMMAASLLPTAWDRRSEDRIAQCGGTDAKG